MRIAIVEDDRIDMSQLRRTLEAFGAEHGMQFEFNTFSSGEAFLAAFSAGKYEMIFFDNYIGETLGITLARHVRETDTEAAGLCRRKLRYRRAALHYETRHPGGDRQSV